jgi:hypothetical protein
MAEHRQSMRHQLQGKQKSAFVGGTCPDENGPCRSHRPLFPVTGSQWSQQRTTCRCSIKKKISLGSDVASPTVENISAVAEAEHKPELIKVSSPSAANEKTKSPAKTVKLSDLLKTDPKKEERQTASVAQAPDQPFDEVQLKFAWTEFAEQRKKFQAEFQMLSQAYELRGNQIIVTLLSPVHETMLNNIKSEMTAFLREKLKNNSIQVSGLLKGTDEKKVIYTNREKFDYLAEKNPLLKELKDRLGLDTDF